MRNRIIIISALTLLIAIIGMRTGIFWDNTTFVTSMGNALYGNGILAWGSFPIDFDPGHPPFIATLIAAAWKLFGRTLFVSHIVIIPFIFGILWQVWSICDLFIDNKKERIYAFLLVIADATLLSQMTLITPDVPLLFFFFVALNGLLRNKGWLKALGLFFLGIVSLRGMMLCGGLFIVDLLLNKRSIKWQPYIIGALPAVAFIVWRLTTKGWIINNPYSNWGNPTEYGSLAGFLKNFTWNIAVLCQRFLDFGRIVPIMFVLFTLVLRRGWKNPKYRKLFIIAIASTSVIWLSSLFIVNTMGHRYYIVSYMLLALLAFMMLREYAHKWVIYCILIVSLLAGNFIIYPDKMAQGWDASLAQLHYWEVRHDMIEYMDKQGIAINKTATFFPNEGEIDAVDINNDHREWAEYTGKEQYLFYSNVFNLPDETIELIHRDYHLVQSFSSFGVRTELYEKNTVP